MNLKEEAANTNWVALVLLVVITGLLSFGIYWWQKQTTVDTTPIEITPTPTQTVKPTATTTPTVTPTPTDETAGWKDYFNDIYGYSIQYPHRLAVDGKYGDEDWEYMETEPDGTYQGTPITNFGPPSTRPGGHVWGVAVNKKSEGLEKIIKEIGNQCDTRKEKRSRVVIKDADNDSSPDLPALVVTVTCGFTDGEGFVSQDVYITKGKYIYQIGGDPSKEFTRFYNSFRL